MTAVLHRLAWFPSILLNMDWRSPICLLIDLTQNMSFLFPGEEAPFL
jgi:hypothetical protein